MKNSIVKKEFERFTNPVKSIHVVTAAKAVKEYLIQLAINDALPLDFNNLNINDIQDIISNS